MDYDYENNPNEHHYWSIRNRASARTKQYGELSSIPGAKLQGPCTDRGESLFISCRRASTRCPAFMRACRATFHFFRKYDPASVEMASTLHATSDFQGSPAQTGTIRRVVHMAAGKSVSKWCRPIAQRTGAVRRDFKMSFRQRAARSCLQIATAAKRICANAALFSVQTQGVVPALGSGCSDRRRGFK